MKVEIETLDLEPDIQSDISHAQSGIELQNPQRARYGLMAAGAAMRAVKIVIYKMTGNEQRRFQEYYTQANKLLNDYWQEYGLVLLKRTSNDEPSAHTGTRKIIHIADDNGHVKDALPMQNGKPRGRKDGAKRKFVPREFKMKIGELAANPPAGEKKEEWYRTIMADHGINNISIIYAYRAFYMAALEAQKTGNQ